MSKCSGCSSGISEVAHSNNNCIHLTGLGTTLSPLVATLQIDPASPSVITCGPSGLSVAGGGGGGTCNQRIYYTVASVGPAGFGGLGATPAPFQACADYIGNGSTDNVALQAAINVAATGAPFVTMPVYINPGYYVLAVSVDTKAVRIIGGSQGSVVIANTISVGGAGGTRLFDNTVSLGPILIEQVSLNAGGAACLVAGGGLSTGIVQVYDCAFAAFSDTGADGAFVLVNNAGNCIVERNIFQVGTSAGVHDAIHLLNGFIPSPRITNNFFSGAGIRLDDMSVTMISNNIFNSIYTTGGAGIPTYTIGLFGICRDNMIINNQLYTLQREGIVLDGTGLGNSCHFNQIIGNHIEGYALSGSVTEDGIRLTGDADQNHIQQNYVRQGGAAGRHGINISAGTCNDNFVTNNDLFNSGAGTSLNDAGTATVLAAGNRL